MIWFRRCQEPWMTVERLTHLYHSQWAKFPRHSGIVNVMSNFYVISAAPFIITCADERAEALDPSYLWSFLRLLLLCHGGCFALFWTNLKVVPWCDNCPENSVFVCICVCLCMSVSNSWDRWIKPNESLAVEEEDLL